MSHSRTSADGRTEEGLLPGGGASPPGGDQDDLGVDQGTVRDQGDTAGYQVALFPAPDAEPLPRPKSQGGRAGVPFEWYRHRVKSRVLCDDCVQVTHEAWPAPSPPIRQATWKRWTPDSSRLLCGEHAAPWKERDGVD